MKPRLQLVTGFATGTLVEPLRLLSARTTEQVDGEDSATFRIRTPTRTDITLRSPLRFVGSDGIQREYRVRRYLRDPLANVATIEAAPPFYDLTTSGLIRQVVNGTQYTAFTGSFTPAQWITNFVLTNLSADGLTWLDTVLGTIESTQLVSLSFTQWTRAELLRTLADALGLDLVFAPVSPGGLYRIHLLTERGADVDPIRISSRGALVGLDIASSDDGIATLVQPIGAVPDGGTEPATIANHVFTVSSIVSGWVGIVDPASTALPIAFDDMANTWYLQFVSGDTVIRRAISDSRASDGAVYLADTSSLAVGMNMTFVADSDGTPLTTLSHPAAITQFGRVLVPLSIEGMRGESNLVSNPNFAFGSAHWSPVGGGWLEPYAPTETSDLVGAMVGSKTPGSPASLNVDGFPAGAVIRRGERVEVAALLLATTSTAKAVPSTGLVTLPLSGTLAQSVTNGQVFRAYQPGGTILLPGITSANGGTSSGASSLAVSAPTLANRQLQTGDQIRFTLGGQYDGLTSSGNTNSNGTGSPIVWTQTFGLSQPLINPDARPQSPTLADGHAVTLVNYATGQTIAAVVDGGYTANATTISLRITVPAGTTYSIGALWIVSTTQTSTETRTVTNSNTEWPDNGIIAVTWGTSLGITDASSITWLTAGGASLGALTRQAYVSGTSWQLRRAVNTIPAGALLYSEPETLYCNGTANVNGSGAVTIPLQVANASSLSDNAVVRIVRNTLGWMDQGAASPTLMRSSTGWESSTFVIQASGARTVWAHFAAHLWHSRNDYPAGLTVAMQLDVVDADTSAVLATVTSDPLPIETAPGADRPRPTACVVKVQLEVTTTTRAFLRARPVTASHAVDYSTKGYALASYAMLTIGADPNVPFTPNAHPNTGWHTAIRYLQEYAREVRSITCTAAQLADIPGAQRIPRRIACGVRVLIQTLRFADTLRVMSYDRDHFNPDRSTMIIETLKRTISRILGTGSVSSGSGGVTSVTGGGSGGGSGVSAGVTVADESGASIPGVQTITFAGSVGLAANGANGARVNIAGAADPDLAVVASGGEWVVRDLVAQPSYLFGVTAGTGIINGRSVSWPASTINTGPTTSLIYVDLQGVVRARPITYPEAIVTNGELALFRSFVDIPTYGPRIFAVIEGRTFSRMEPRGQIFYESFIRDCVIQSGPYAGAVKVHTNAGSKLNFYFGNVGLMPFVETLPSIVQDHLDVQIALFYSTATGTGATNWTALHGTTHTDQTHWPYDVDSPEGTPVLVRADSHDSYAATFLELAVRYAQVASGGLAWWDANYAAIKNCYYANLISRQQFVGSGYMQQTFQDLAVYPFLQTMDNFECYVALRETFALMTSRGGAQAADASFYASWVTNLLAGIRSMWVTGTPNAQGESDWIAIYYDTTTSTRVVNQLSSWYPEIVAHSMPWWGDVTISDTESVHRDFLNKCLLKFRKVPHWHKSRRYDLYPWGFTAFCITRAGHRVIGEQWIDYVQRHHAVDSTGYLQINDVGLAFGVQRLLEGDRLYWG